MTSAAIGIHVDNGPSAWIDYDKAYYFILYPRLRRSSPSPTPMIASVADTKAEGSGKTTWTIAADGIRQTHKYLDREDWGSDRWQGCRRRC